MLESFPGVRFAHIKNEKEIERKTNEQWADTYTVRNCHPALHNKGILLFYTIFYTEFFANRTTLHNHKRTQPLTSHSDVAKAYISFILFSSVNMSLQNIPKNWETFGELSIWKIIQAIQ